MSEQQPMQQIGTGLFSGPTVPTAPTPSVYPTLPQPPTVSHQTSVAPYQPSVVSDHRSVASEEPPIRSSHGDTNMNDADATRRHLNDTERQKVIEAILNAPDNNASLIKQAWEKNIPDDCDINYRVLLVNLHPDKFRIPEEKAKAQEAFQSEISPK